MPNEMRKMVFTSEELQAALINYALRTKKKLPNSTIDQVLVEGINVNKKHQKPQGQSMQGGVIDKSMPINVINKWYLEIELIDIGIEC